MNTPYASASLYVGDLASDVTEGMLFEIFNQVGPVASIRVCRDAVTRRSLGYAYVNYHNVVDAERALDTLNSSLIKAKPCRVMWSQRDPSLRKSGVGNIFIKNLDKTIDHKALYDTFSAFGNILSCKVVTDDTNSSKGYGFVHFETKEAAEKAIAKVNGMMLNNQKVFVGPFVTRKERLKTQDGEQKYTNVYIKNLDDSVTTDQLRQVFSEFGTVTNAAVMSDEGSKSKGFGFVNFENPEAAKKAVEALNAKDNAALPHAKDKPLYVGRAQKKAERESELRAKFEALKLERLNKYQGVNLYVKNLEDNVDDDKLRAEFAPFGTITSCKVMRDDKQGNSKGFGFVCYSTPEEATRSVTEMNGRIIGTKPLYVALAQRREVRKAQLEAQHAQRAKMRQNAPAMGPMAYAPPGAPVFYPPQPGGIPPQGSFVPYQQMMPRNSWRAQPQPGYQQVPHYMVNVAQRQQHPSQRPPRGAAGQGQAQGVVSGGPKGDQARGAQNGRRAGRNPPNPARTDLPPQVPQLQPDLLQPTPGMPVQMPMIPDANAPLTVQLLSQFPPDQQRNIVGERIYPLIAKMQPELAGKITGMLLDSFYTEEMLQLIDNSEALYAKVQEAVDVLKANEIQPVQ